VKQKRRTGEQEVSPHLLWRDLHILSALSVYS